VAGAIGSTGGTSSLRSPEGCAVGATRESLATNGGSDFARDSVGGCNVDFGPASGKAAVLVSKFAVGGDTADFIGGVRSVAGAVSVLWPLGVETAWSPGRRVCGIAAGWSPPGRFVGEIAAALSPGRGGSVTGAARSLRCGVVEAVPFWSPPCFAIVLPLDWSVGLSFNPSVRAISDAPARAWGLARSADFVPDNHPTSGKC